MYFIQNTNTINPLKNSGYAVLVTKHFLSLNVYYRKCHVNFRKYKVLEYKNNSC